MNLFQKCHAVQSSSVLKDYTVFEFQIKQKSIHLKSVLLYFHSLQKVKWYDSKKSCDCNKILDQIFSK